jgi:hypothetical protein
MKDAYKQAMDTFVEAHAFKNHLKALIIKAVPSLYINDFDDPTMGYAQVTPEQLLLKGAQSPSPVLYVFKLSLLQIMRLLIYSFFHLRFSQQSISQCLTIAMLFFSILTIAFLILSCSHDRISRLVDHVVHVT